MDMLLFTSTDDKWITTDCHYRNAAIEAMELYREGFHDLVMSNAVSRVLIAAYARRN